MVVADGRGAVCPRLGVRRQRRRACDRRSREMLHNFRRSLRERGKKDIIMYGRPSYAAEINRIGYFKSKRKNEKSRVGNSTILPAKKMGC